MKPLTLILLLASFVCKGQSKDSLMGIFYTDMDTNKNANIYVKDLPTKHDAWKGIYDNALKDEQIWQVDPPLSAYLKSDPDTTIVTGLQLRRDINGNVYLKDIKCLFVKYNWLQGKYYSMPDLKEIQGIIMGFDTTINIQQDTK